VIYILVVSYFFLNLFVGVMFSRFNEAINKEKTKGLKGKEGAEKYLDFLMQIETSKPEYSTFKKPEVGLRKYLYMITTNKYFDNFIMMIIIFNLITMAMNYEASSDAINKILETVNLVFTSIFIAECTLKLCANGVNGYFYYGWNKFDFFVVASSIVDLLVTNLTDAKSAFLKSFQIIRVLRVLRVTR